ncbi:MAG: acyltransferase [Lachnospiraceae bacterium]|nr:acyltransferase [Lachnospiraceae bacterium]
MGNVKQRKVYLDLLRIIAIIFVIYNHTSEKGYYLYAFECPLPLKVIYMSAGALIAVAVPIFFMISGALLIPKEESIEDLYKKRVLRMFIALVIFSVIQYAFQIVFENQEMSIRYFLDHTVSGNITASYWYLYSYLAYLICLPLIRKMALNMSNKEFKYLFVAFLIIEGLLTTVVFFTMDGSLNSFFAIPFFKNIILYPLLGYYMEHRLKEEDYNAKGVMIWLAVMVATIALVVVASLYRDLPYEEFTDWDKGLYTTGFSMLLVAGVFYIVKTIFKGRKVPKPAALIITTLGGTVFGVYLIENMIRALTTSVYGALQSVCGSYIAAWIWCLFVFLVGAVITFILKLIPGVKKLL